ncbi:MAG: ABC transporter permease [Chromatiales bacterium]|nr:ABC transporter permease [Chromatiales bacterium]
MTQHGENETPADEARVEARIDGGKLTLTISGDWLLASQPPGREALLAMIREAGDVHEVGFSCDRLGRWDAALLVPLQALQEAVQQAGVQLDDDGLPEGARRLLRLAATVRERSDVRRVREHDNIIVRIGNATLEALAAGRELARFMGELSFSAGRLVTGRAVFERRDLLLFLEQTGANALPIVSLIAFLTGVIFAFVGVMQLQRFGAGIYVADLVAIGMVREMAAIMTGIILAGRSGAAFAAQLGTMKINEEIDALRTLGISPMDYLVLPRAIALVLMMPLLTIYAALLGLVGGAVVSITMLDISLVQYLAQARSAVGLNSVFAGLLKALVYGVMIAISGCQQGLACGGSAMAVGQATTSAVVMSVLLIVISASALTVIYTVFGI